MDDKAEALEVVLKEAVDLVPKQSNPSLSFQYYFLGFVDISLLNSLMTLFISGERTH